MQGKKLDQYKTVINQFGFNQSNIQQARHDGLPRGEHRREKKNSQRHSAVHYGPE